MRLPCALNPNENPAQFGILFSANRLRCWFAIDIAIRYRYRSCPAFPIASSDIDSEPWKEHESVCGSPRYVIRIAPINPEFNKSLSEMLRRVLVSPRCKGRYPHARRASRVLRPSKFEGHCPMIRHGCRMALMVALNWSVECVKEES